MRARRGLLEKRDRVALPGPMERLDHRVAGAQSDPRGRGGRGEGCWARMPAESKRGRSGRDVFAPELEPSSRLPRLQTRGGLKRVLLMSMLCLMCLLWDALSAPLKI